MPQRAVAQLPDQALSVGNLALRVVPLQDGDHLGEQGDKVASLDVAVLLQLGDEPHEGGGVGRVLGAQLLELGAEQSQGELARPELECGGIANQDFQLMQKVRRRHCSWQRSHLQINVMTRKEGGEITSSLAAAALDTADMTLRKERGVTGIPSCCSPEHSSFEAKIASIRSRSEAEHRD